MVFSLVLLLLIIYTNLNRLATRPGLCCLQVVTSQYFGIHKLFPPVLLPDLLLDLVSLNHLAGVEILHIRKSYTV